MVVADYERQWQFLSKTHEMKDKEIQQTLDSYKDDKSIKYMAYAILGTYGIGKTHLLYHIHKQALERSIIPLYFLAEDLFREILVDSDQKWTPGNLYSLIEDKIMQFTTFLSSKAESEIRNLIDPRGKMRKDSPEVIDSILNKYHSTVPENPKYILLVDELEGQYRNLQERIQTQDRSPLREWLESKTHIKFLSFAPAGIYELGGADRDRVRRIVIPSADVNYLRDNLIKDVGKSNACWWLSRGKARQLFKVAEVLNEKEDEHLQDSTIAARIIKDELDSIGQPPTEVPPAVLDKITPTNIPFLLRLEPISCGRGRRYIIDAGNLRTGELANRIIDAFGIKKSNALLISEYFKKTTLALSDEDWLTYINEGDLPELFCLVLDHFLEYEHGSPELSKSFGEILSLYEKSREEPAAMHGTIGTLWERKETEKGLPLSIEDIREAFPFPTMNPIVKDYVPETMKRKWEGRASPIWKWTDGNVTYLFFASARDFTEYAKKDEFLSISIPDGKGVMCLLPYGENIKRLEIGRTIKWLETNKKLRIIGIQHLITDFLLSISGELSVIPGDLKEILDTYRENKDDVLLTRKMEIYERALENTVEDETQNPIIICRGNPPDAESVWGHNQIGYRAIAVSGIAAAFEIMKPEEMGLLADLRELFRGGREGRGISDLRYLIATRDAPGRGGHTRLPDRLLPYRARGAGLRNTENIERIKVYWNSEEIDNIAELARDLSLGDFLKLQQDEDQSRLLEALWRTVRKEFDIGDLDGYIVKLERIIIPTLQTCQGLENTGNEFGLTGIDFGDYTNLVKSLPGYKQLLELTKKAKDASTIVKSIFSILIETTDDTDKDIRDLGNSCANAKRAIDELKASAEHLIQNVWEYKKAVKFADLNEDNVKDIISEQMKMEGTPDLEEVEGVAEKAKGLLDEFSSSLSELDGKLNDVEGIFTSKLRRRSKK